MAAAYKRIVVKIGSNVLTMPDGLPDQARIEHLVSEIAALKNAGITVVLISSGAVAAGR